MHSTYKKMQFEFEVHPLCKLEKSLQQKYLETVFCIRREKMLPYNGSVMSIILIDWSVWPAETLHMVEFFNFVDFYVY